jgi:predicted dehydrogenase
MRIAFVGCGYVADLYMSTLSLHPNLELVGVYDRDSERQRQFCRYHKVRGFDSYDALLADDDVQIVVNLTNPRSHFEVTRRALEAGRHVYSEKPLAMSYSESRALVTLAEARSLSLAGAPSTLLGETAQTLWKALRREVVGRVRLVYAEMDEGLLPRFQYRTWYSASGKQWPYRDEFEVGCTLEHAGYVLTWLAAMFGPARSVTAFSSELYPHKLGPEGNLTPAADFSVACIQFANGVVARMTNSIIAEHDHKFRVFGDLGVVEVKDSWFGRSPVKFRRLWTIRRKTFLSPFSKRMALVGGHLSKPKSPGAQSIDFSRGIAELASSIQEGRACRLNGRFALHVTELALATQYASESSSTYVMQSTFDPVEPMEWAL